LAASAWLSTGDDLLDRRVEPRVARRVAHLVLGLGEHHQRRERVDVLADLGLHARAANRRHVERVAVALLDLRHQVAEAALGRLGVRAAGARRMARAEQREQRHRRVGDVRDAHGRLVRAQLLRLVALAPAAALELARRQPREPALDGVADRLGLAGLLRLLHRRLDWHRRDRADDLRVARGRRPLGDRIGGAGCLRARAAPEGRDQGCEGENGGELAQHEETSAGSQRASLGRAL
jgi:hypothetical protein